MICMIDIAKEYKSKRWKRFRQSILRRDNFLCQESNKYGKAVEANTVHHIYPAKDYPELFYNPFNLVSLSSKEHNKMHDRITDEITLKGVYWQEKRKREIENWEKNRTEKK